METRALENKAIQQVKLVRFRDGSSCSDDDDVSVEEPLEISISAFEEGSSTIKNISVTMRTPGHDTELAAGFLFTEGIIDRASHIRRIQHVVGTCDRNSSNRILVELNPGVVPRLHNADRNFYTTSSCGVCGKGSIEAIKTVSIFRCQANEPIEIALDTLYLLSERLQSSQNNFSATGGIHAAAIFDLQGRLVALREDVGRHNALDKLIGYALLEEMLPLKCHILLLSGRASFELIQKAAMAGAKLVVAIGAPSSLAISTAAEFNITLLGFLRGHSFNIYHAGDYFTLKDPE